MGRKWAYIPILVYFEWFYGFADGGHRRSWQMWQVWLIQGLRDG